MIHALEKSLMRRAHEGIKFRKSYNYFDNPTTYYIVHEKCSKRRREGKADNGGPQKR